MQIPWLQNKSVSKPRWILIGLAFVLLATALIVREINKSQTIRSRAVVKQARIFVLPQNAEVGNETTFQVWATTDAPLVFARVALSFNRSIVNLSQEITLVNTALSTVVSQTSKADANATGSIVFVVAKNPTSTAASPAGTFQLATIKIIPNTAAENASATLAVNLTDSQLVADDATEFALTAGNATLIVNPVAPPQESNTPTRTPTPTTGNAPTATKTPTPTLTPALTPTKTPTPTLLPNQTPTPTPVVTHTLTPTPTSTQQTFRFSVKLAGVTDNSAEGAKINVKFYEKNGTITQLSSPLTLTYTSNGTYRASAIITNPYPPETQLRIKIKGEKHIAVQFCRRSGQTVPCQDYEYITIPDQTSSIFDLDFTGIPLPPGDLAPQDGQANRADLDKLTPLMSKICANLTTQDRLIGDVDYNGCVNVRDVFLILQTLETRYDE